MASASAKRARDSTPEGPHAKKICKKTPEDEMTCLVKNNEKFNVRKKVFEEAVDNKIKIINKHHNRLILEMHWKMVSYRNEIEALKSQNRKLTFELMKLHRDSIQSQKEELESLTLNNAEVDDIFDSTMDGQFPMFGELL